MLRRSISLLLAGVLLHGMVFILMFRLYFHTGQWVPVLPLSPPHVMAPPPSPAAAAGAAAAASDIDSWYHPPLQLPPALTIPRFAPETPPAAPTAAAAPASAPFRFPALAKRVVLFMVDGLSLEMALRNNNSLFHDIITRRGTWGVCYTPAPTESVVGHGVVLTGARPEPHTVLPWRTPRAGTEIDSLFARVTHSFSVWSTSQAQVWRYVLPYLARTAFVDFRRWLHASANGDAPPRDLSRLERNFVRDFPWSDTLFERGSNDVYDFRPPAASLTPDAIDRAGATHIPAGTGASIFADEPHERLANAYVSEAEWAKAIDPIRIQRFMEATGCAKASNRRSWRHRVSRNPPPHTQRVLDESGEYSSCLEYNDGGTHVVDLFVKRSCGDSDTRMAQLMRQFWETDNSTIAPDAIFLTNRFKDWAGVGGSAPVNVSAVIKPGTLAYFDWQFLPKPPPFLRRYGIMYSPWAHASPSIALHELIDEPHTGLPDSAAAGDAEADPTLYYIEMNAPDCSGHDEQALTERAAAYISEMVAQFRARFGESDDESGTAFVIVSDHGTLMDRHGWDHPRMTQTPYFAFGAGVNRPIPPRDSARASIETDTPRFHPPAYVDDATYFRSYVRDDLSRPDTSVDGRSSSDGGGIGHRVDVDQTDIAPLIAALLGVSTPVHSIGRLRTAILNTTAAAVRSQARIRQRVSAETESAESVPSWVDESIETRADRLRFSLLEANTRQLLTLFTHAQHRLLMPRSQFQSYPPIAPSTRAEWTKELNRELESDANGFVSGMRLLEAISEASRFGLDYVFRYDHEFFFAAVAIAHCAFFVLVMASVFADAETPAAAAAAGVVAPDSVENGSGFPYLATFVAGSSCVYVVWWYGSTQRFDVSQLIVPTIAVVLAALAVAYAWQLSNGCRRLSAPTPSLVVLKPFALSAALLLCCLVASVHSLRWYSVGILLVALDQFLSFDPATESAIDSARNAERVWLHTVQVRSMLVLSVAPFVSELVDIYTYRSPLTVAAAAVATGYVALRFATLLESGSPSQLLDAAPASLWYQSFVLVASCALVSTPVGSKAFTRAGWAMVCISAALAMYRTRSSLHRGLGLFLFVQQLLVLTARGYEPFVTCVLFIVLFSQLLLYHPFNTSRDGSGGGGAGGSGTSWSPGIAYAVYDSSVWFWFWLHVAFFSLNDIRTGEYAQHRQPFSWRVLLYPFNPRGMAYGILQIMYLSTAPCIVAIVWCLSVLKSTATDASAAGDAARRLLRTSGGSGDGDANGDSAATPELGHASSNGANGDSTPPAPALAREFPRRAWCGGAGIFAAALSITLVVFSAGAAPIAYYVFTHVQLPIDIPAGAAWAATGRDILRLALYSFAAPVICAVFIVGVLLLSLFIRP